MSTRSTFGKFHGHTLGQIAAFEPSYIDWLAGTVTHDPELVAPPGSSRPTSTGAGSAACPAAHRAGRAAPAAPPELCRTRDRPPIPEGDLSAE